MVSFAGFGLVIQLKELDWEGTTLAYLLLAPLLRILFNHLIKPYITDTS